ncbi:hypothetical protein ACTMTI_34420 [Nonomuraea sp. H19]|uniref:hypothetical protein n=1 Tax=Nonomuraea sp. H19 TaxID=3452206 RepID=UPI003F8B5184
MPILARFTAAALLITLTACADSRAAPPAPLAAATHTTTPTTPTTSAPTPTPTTSSAQTPTAGPQAADGRSLAACEDADCEVEIRAGDEITIGKRFGVQELTIGFIHSDEVGIAFLGSSGGLRVEGRNVSVSGSCVNGECRDEGKLSLTPSEPGRINTMRLELTHLSGDRAILRLAPK